MGRRRVTFVAAVSAALATAVVAVGPAPAATAVNPGSAKHFGVWAQPAAGQSKVAAAQALEGSTGLAATLPMVSDYLAWDEAFPNALSSWVASGNRVLMLFVKLKLRDGSRPKWSALAKARKGSQLYADMDRWAAALKTYAKPVYFVFHKEPNEPANAVQGSPANYRAAYRAFVLHMRANGVTNVRYVWALPGTVFATSASATSWYPGDDVVDVIAATGSNEYNCIPGVTPRWRSFATIFAAMRTWATTLHPARRIGVVEFETVADPAQPGRQAQWINDAHAVASTSAWSQLEVLGYSSSIGTDTGGTCDFRLTSSTTLAAARSWAQDKAFGA